MERNLRRAASEMPPAADPKAAKKQRVAEAKERLAAKKKAWKKEKLQQEYGVSTEHEKSAIKAGFTKPDGAADTTAYNRHLTEQKAIKAGFTTPDGAADTTAYKRHLTEQSAIKAGFTTPDGAADTTAYNRHLTEQSARNYVDVAGNHPYVKSDGSVDVAGYKRNVNQQRQDDDTVSALLALAQE